MKIRNKKTGETREFDCVCVNSALVSAQNRQRLYWVGKRNADGTYSKVDVQQPEDRGILLRDVLDGYEPVNTTVYGKSQTLKAQYSNTNATNICCYNSTYGASGVAEPVCIASRGRYSDTDSRSSKTDAPTYQHYEARTDGKTNAVTTVSKDNLIGEPVRCFTLPREDGVQTQSKQYRVYDVDGKSTTLCAEGGGMGAKTGLYAMPIEFSDLIIRKNAHVAVNDNAIRGVQDKNNASCAENFYEFTDTKANTLTTAHRPKIIDKLSNYTYLAEACEWNKSGEPTKALSYTDGKKYAVYTVKDGQITIKEKQYPIKLVDGYYIIRKLTVSECKRLQTVPEWHEFPVSDTQAYKMLGNGFTINVIAHLIEATRRNN